MPQPPQPHRTIVMSLPYPNTGMLLPESEGYLVFRCRHLPPVSAGTVANVGIEKPLENMDTSEALNLTFANELTARPGQCQIRSTGMTHGGGLYVGSHNAGVALRKSGSNSTLPKNVLIIPAR
jgi:hypothetical protein